MLLVRRGGETTKVFVESKYIKLMAWVALLFGNFFFLKKVNPNIQLGKEKQVWKRNRDVADKQCIYCLSELCVINIYKLEEQKTSLY